MNLHFRIINSIFKCHRIKHSFALILFMAVFYPMHMQGQAIIDLRDHDLAKNTFSLTGPWEVYPFVILESKERVSPDQLVNLPHLWNFGGETQGFVSYRTQIILPTSVVGKEIALKMPDVYSSFSAIINGERLANNGTVGMSATEENPQWLPSMTTFTPLQDTLEVIIQISNFHHSKGGIDKPILISAAHLMKTTWRDTFVAESLLFVILTMIGFASLVTSVVMSFRLLPFYFGILCVSWAIRTVFSNNYVAVQLFNEIDWTLVVRTEYISFYAATLFGLLFVRELFPLELSRRLTMLYVFASLAFTVFTLAFSPSIFTRFVSVYLAFSAFLLISVLFVTLRAFVLDRKGVNIMMLSILLATGVFGYVILSYYKLVAFNIYVFILSFAAVFLLSGTALWKHLKNEVPLTGHPDVS